jgi:membrane protease YdiL (CAAX protease family)
VNSSTNSTFEYFHLRKILRVPALAWLLLVVMTYIATILAWYFDFKITGKMGGHEPNVWMIFVPIYEELIFRGLLLKYFERYGKVTSIFITSTLFGLWHLKNIFWLDPTSLRDQILYTALIFSPITCFVTQKTKSIWPAVILHYLNNFPFRLFL